MNEIEKKLLMAIGQITMMAHSEVQYGDEDLLNVGELLMDVLEELKSDYLSDKENVSIA